MFMSWGTFGCESPGWRWTTSCSRRRGDAAGEAGVNMVGPGVEAVIVLRRALVPAGFVDLCRVAEGNQVHTPVSPGVPCEDWLPPPPASARDFGTCNRGRPYF